MNQQSNADRALELYLDWRAAGRPDDLPEVDFVLTGAERAEVAALIHVAELLAEGRPGPSSARPL